MEVSREALERAEAACGDYPFYQRLRDLLAERGISTVRFAQETGMARRVFYPGKGHRWCRSTLMALAYYFGITVGELVEGTDAAEYWYRLWEE